MTPRERFLATLRGRPHDQVPIEAAGLQFEGRAAIAEVQDPLRRELAQRVHAQTHFWHSVPSCVNRYLVTPPQRITSESRKLADGHRHTTQTIDTPRGELTAVLDYDPDSRTTWQVKYPVETEDDVEKIASVPWERPEKLAPPDLPKLPAEFGERGVCTTAVSSPMVCVAGTMQYEQFLEWTLTRPALVQQLTDICLKRILDVLAVLLSEPGIEHVWMGGSEWVTAPMACPATYDALVQEQERAIIEWVHAHSEAVVHVHCHGRVRHALGRTIERGGDYTEPVEPPPDGDITMAEAKELVAGRITLGGNVEARVLCNESVETLERAVRAAFDGDNQRFVLRATEGPSPKIAEREFANTMRMVELWEELSSL